MRIAFAGLVIATLSCGLALAQNAAQPGAAGQRLQPQAGQTQPGQPGQVRGGQGEQRNQQGQQGRAGQQGQAGQPGQPGQQQGQASMTDQQIAHCINLGNRNEVEMAKFAQSRLESQQAKQFAEHMIKDHTQATEDFQKFAGNLAHQQGAGQRSGNQAQGGNQAQAGGQPNWVAIHQEIAQQCLESSQKELGKEKGADFDKGYMTLQVVCHMEMKDKLTVFKNHASPQLAQQIDKALETVEHHLQDAKQIMEQMKDRPSERGSRTDKGSK